MTCNLFAGSGIDIRSECLRKLSSHTAVFDVGRSVEEGTGHCLSQDSEICVESNVFGIRPFYIPRGSSFVLV